MKVDLGNTSTWPRITYSLKEELTNFLYCLYNCNAPFYQVSDLEKTFIFSKEKQRCLSERCIPKASTGCSSGSIHLSTGSTNTFMVQTLELCSSPMFSGIIASV